MVKKLFLDKVAKYLKSSRQFFFVATCVTFVITIKRTLNCLNLHVTKKNWCRLSLPHNYRPVAKFRWHDEKKISRERVCMSSTFQGYYYYYYFSISASDTSIVLQSRLAAARIFQCFQSSRRWAPPNGVSQPPSRFPNYASRQWW